MKKKTKPFYKIEITASNLLEINNALDCPATHIDAIIQSCSIDIIKSSVKDESFLGFYGKSNDKKFIVYNGNMINSRVLFTKAHELGHYVLDHNLSFDVVKDFYGKNKNSQETEANVFASAFLMPKQQFIKAFVKELNKKYFGKSDNCFKTFTLLSEVLQNQIIHTLKEQFQTSFEATKFRIQNLAKDHGVAYVR